MNTQNEAMNEEVAKAISSKRECDCGAFWDAECSSWVKPGDVVMTDETSSG
jgi:hypothetical protein